MINNRTIGYANNYSAGDVATVRHDLLDVDSQLGVMICGSMYRWAGQQLHITRVGTSMNGRFYIVKENEYEWQDHMLEPCDSIDMTAMDSLLL